MIGSSIIRVLWGSELRRYEKLTKISKNWTDADLDKYEGSDCHLHRNVPKKKERAA